MSHTTIAILDWTVSFLTMGSFLYASLRKQRFDLSLQFNIANLIAGVIFLFVGLSLHTYGLAFRQLFFGIIAGRNLYCMYRSHRTLIVR